MVQIITIANQKGGVGKTTTAINLSACLAAAEKQVLLLDVDPQGNASSGVGAELQEDAPTLYELLMEDIPAEDTILPTSLPNLFVMPSNQDLIAAEVELLQVPEKETVLRRKLQPLGQRFDYIIIDSPPGLGYLTINALNCADDLIIPLQPEYFPLEGLSHMLKTVRILRQTYNPNLNLRGILLTMFDPRNRLSHQVAAEVRRHFPDKVFQSVIPRNVRLSESPSHGQPIIMYDIRSSGAEAYLTFTKEILNCGR